VRMVLDIIKIRRNAHQGLYGAPPARDKQ